MLQAQSGRRVAPARAHCARAVVVRAASQYEPTLVTPVTPAVDTTAAPAPGDKVVEWIKSPFDFASFGPRLAVGYAMSRLAQPTKITGELETLRNLIQSPAPLEDKGKLVAAELETCAPCKPVIASPLHAFCHPATITRQPA